MRSFLKKGIEKAYRIMEKNTEIDVLLCGGVKFKGDKKYYAYVPSGARYGRYVRDVFRYGGNGLGMMIRRISFARSGLFNTNALSLDNDYLCQAINAGLVVRFCRIKMFHHFLEEHSVTVAKPSQMTADFLRIKKKYGIEQDPILQFRIWFSREIFSRLPKFIQDFYIQEFKDVKKVRAIKPVWDGGFS